MVRLTKVKTIWTNEVNENQLFGKNKNIHSFGESKIQRSDLDKTSIQSVGSSLVMDNIIRTIVHFSIKTITKIGSKKLEEIFYI